MKVLILGKGYISKFLIDIFNGKDYKVDNFSRKELDYTDEDELYSILSTEPYEAVINTVGFTGRPNVDECETRRQECFDLNVKLPKTIESICKLCDVNFIHISSGCIYTGYDKQYTEESEPNFGMFNDEASFYSKTKHAGEMMLDKNFTNIIRIRMPIEDKLSPKNLLTKLLKYDYLIDFVNSKTDVYKLSEFVYAVVENFKAGIYNAVHSNALSTKEVVEILKEYDLDNENWNFIPYAELDIKANRSNCVLDNSKSEEDFNFEWGDEETYIRLNASLISNRKNWNAKE